MHEAILGPENPRAVNTLSNLITALRAAGRETEAERYQARLERIRDSAAQSGR